MTSQRDTEIIARRRAGGTLQAIGDRFGITRERVRQIVTAAGVPSAYHRSDETERILTERRDEVFARWREGPGWETIAQEFDVSKQATREFLETNASIEDWSARSEAMALGTASGAGYSRDELIEAIRRAERLLGRVPGAGSYDKLARKHGWPRYNTISYALGWPEAVRAAGFEPVSAGWRRGGRRS